MEQLQKEERELLQEVILKHAEDAAGILNVELVNITVYPNKNFVIPETGEGGYAVSGDWLQVYIDATREKEELKKIIKNAIPSTIYHEMNHVARWRVVGYGESLMEAMVSEGLATVFELQFGKDDHQIPWSRYTDEEIEKLLEITRGRDKENDFDYKHSEWFFGSKEIPRWLGYKVGTYIIREFFRKNAKLSWEEATGMECRRIVELSGLDLI